MSHHLPSSSSGPSDIRTHAKVRQQYYQANHTFKEVEPHGVTFVRVDERSSADNRSTTTLHLGEEAHVKDLSSAEEEPPVLALTALSPAERAVFDKLESWHQTLIRYQPEDAKSLIAIAADEAERLAEIPYLAQDHRNVFYWTPNGAMVNRTYADALHNRFPSEEVYIYSLSRISKLRGASRGSPAPLHTCTCSKLTNTQRKTQRVEMSLRKTGDGIYLNKCNVV